MFHVGQLVVCVEDRPYLFRVPGHEYRSEMHGLTKGSIYTIREVDVVHPDGHHVGVRLEEIRRPGKDCPYVNYRFRPLDESRLTVFRQMLVSPPTKELVEDHLDASIADCERAVREALGF